MIRLGMLFLALALAGCAVNYHFDSPDADSRQGSRRGYRAHKIGWRPVWP
jgi:hypothetical protein